MESLPRFWEELSSQPPGGSPAASTESPIFVVDDDEMTVQALVHFLGDQGYQVKGFQDPIVAAEAIRTNHPQLLITDRKMPGLSGFDLARRALEEDPDISVVILTGSRDVELPIQAFRLGAADYLLKPLDLKEIEETVGRILSRRAQAIFRRGTEERMQEEAKARARELQRKNEELEAVTVGALSALVRIQEARTRHFEGHSRAVANLSERLARELGLPPGEVSSCKTAGFLHDIGMIAVPDRILEKSNPLIPEEAAQVQKHCKTGMEILQPFTHLGPVPEYIFAHHERVDGSGYPEGLTENEIPLGGQIVGVAETFTALVESRPFRPAHSPSVAIEIMGGTAGVWYSQEVLDALAVVPLWDSWDQA